MCFQAMVKVKPCWYKRCISSILQPLVQTKGIFYKIDGLITGFRIPAFRTKLRNFIHQISRILVRLLVFQCQSCKDVGIWPVDAGSLHAGFLHDLEPCVFWIKQTIITLKRWWNFVKTKHKIDYMWFEHGSSPTYASGGICQVLYFSLWK
jgi:hypothetical protein